MSNRKIDSIVKNINLHFGFIYDRGYKIRLAEYSPQFNGNWVVELESLDCVIFITSDRNRILIEFSSVRNKNPRNRISIERLLYLLSNGQNIVKPFEGNLAWGEKKQFERLSRLLKEHIDQITSYFGDDKMK